MEAPRPFSGYSEAKKLDEQIPKVRQEDGRDPMPGWKLHDLRWTVKTLMAGAEVRQDISERVLSHVIPGVEGVYDCYSYLPEERDALDKLAALVDRIGKYEPPSSTADRGAKQTTGNITPQAAE